MFDAKGFKECITNELSNLNIRDLSDVRILFSNKTNAYLTDMYIDYLDKQKNMQFSNIDIPIDLVEYSEEVYKYIKENTISLESFFEFLDCCISINHNKRNVHLHIVCEDEVLDSIVDIAIDRIIYTEKYFSNTEFADQPKYTKLRFLF